MSGKNFPKAFRQGYQARRYEDVNGNVRFICSILAIALECEIYLGGSYANGIPSLSSDIDLYLIRIPSTADKVKAEKYSNMFGVKIQLGKTNELLEKKGLFLVKEWK